MTFLRHLRAAWLYLRFMPYVEAADHEDYWTEADSQNTQQFWNSPTGQKLRDKWGNLVIKSAVNATLPATDPVHRCGHASGVAATLAWFASHLPKAPPAQAELEPDVMEELFQ